MLNELLVVAAGIVIGLAALAGIYAWWTRATDDERGQALVDTSRRLVEWAEETYANEAGSSKFVRVMGRLRDYFPAATDKQLEEYIQQAVLHVKGSAAARRRSAAAKLNGQNDA